MGKAVKCIKIKLKVPKSFFQNHSVGQIEVFAEPICFDTRGLDHLSAKRKK